MLSSSTKRLGYWAAVCASLFSLAYGGGQLLEWAGILGSAGGPESTSTPVGLALLLTPSFLLGSAFLELMEAVHAAAPAGEKAWSGAGLAFATAYATLTGLVYFTQLTLVAPRMAAGDTEGIEYLVFVPYRSFLFAVDLLGYSFMSLATLFGAFALPGTGIVVRWARRAMIANGLVAPFLIFQMYLPVLIWPASVWAVTFPASTILLARLFRSAPSA